MSNTSKITELPSKIPAMAFKKVGADAERWEYTPKNFTEDDVDLVVLSCGICGSDKHQINNDWGLIFPDGPPEKCLLPLVPGHEVVGRAIRVGKNAQGKFKVGDVLGLGAQAYRCMECERCKSGLDNSCVKGKSTYAFKFTDEANKELVQHYGGFSGALRTHYSMLVKVPEGFDQKYVGPLLCAGVTTFAPLSDFKVGKGQKIGIIGIGGLGHLAIQFASKMGADVVAISRSDKKKELALKLGAKEYINTSKDKPFEMYMGTFDMLLVTAAGGSFSVPDHAPLVKPKGRIHIVGAVGKPLTIPVFSLIMTQISVSGSAIGSMKQMEEMLEFAAKNDVKPMIETFPHTKANEAIAKMEAGTLRFRAVLLNDLM